MQESGGGGRPVGAPFGVNKGAGDPDLFRVHQECHDDWAQPVLKEDHPSPHILCKSYGFQSRFAIPHLNVFSSTVHASGLHFKSEQGSDQ